MTGFTNSSEVLLALIQHGAVKAMPLSLVVAVAIRKYLSVIMH
jgi:hypothetical protein